MADIKGRPKKAIVQEKFVGYFVTKAQHLVIQQKAAKAKVNISDYMRQVAVNAYVKAKWTKKEREMVKTLIAMSAEVHRLVEMARKDGAAQTALYFSECRGVMDNLINALCHDR